MRGYHTGGIDLEKLYRATLNFWTLRAGANSRLGAYSNQYGMLVLEEAKIMVYITAGDDDFQNIQNGGQGRSQEEY